MSWDDPARKVAALSDEIRRLKARAFRWGAAETAEALEVALVRAEAEVARTRGAAQAPAGRD